MSQALVVHARWLHQVGEGIASLSLFAAPSDQLVETLSSVGKVHAGRVAADIGRTVKHVKTCREFVL